MINTTPQCSFSLENVKTLLVKLDRGRNEQAIKNNLAMLRFLGAKENIALLLNQIINNYDLLSEISARSYIHTNYFDKIVLVDSRDNGYRLTLHVWWPPYSDEQLNEERIHSHRFDFWSVILTGTLCSQFFQQVSKGRILNTWTYIPEETNTDSSLRYVGQSRLKAELCTEKNPGDLYYLPYTSIHRVALPNEQITSTLVLRGPRLRASAKVYNSSPPIASAPVSPPAMKIEDLFRKLSTLCDLVSAG
jgi:hypothetical protein